MKIVIIGANNTDCMEGHMNEALINQGFDSEIVGYEVFLNKKIDLGLTWTSMHFVERKNKKLLQKVLSKKPDLVIAVYRHVHPLVVKGIKNEGVKIIHINPDQITTLQNQQLFVEPYDAYFTKDPYILRFMKDKLQLNAFLYSEAFNPRLHRRPQMDLKELEEEVDIDVLCFGNLYPYRNRMLRLLKEKGVKITTFGFKAKYFDDYMSENFQNRGIFEEEKAKILNGAKIVFNNLHYAEIESVNAKFFEINGCGAFQICDYKPILNDLLPIDPKKISFTTIEEGNDLIIHYLNEPEERYEIRDVIHKYFLKKYTYDSMMKEIFEKI